MLNKIRFNTTLIRTITNCAYNFNKVHVASSTDFNEVDSGIQFKKLRLNDKELSETILTIKSKKRKQRDQKIIIEGNVLIKEALKAHLKPDKFIFSDIRKLNDFYKDITKLVGNNVVNSIENLRVPQTDLTFYSALTTCPGLIAIFDKPQQIAKKPNALPITVISDGCKEPNNVGALIRVCNSLPISELLLPKGNVDIWDTKSIRGSSGSVFHLPTQTQLTWEEIDQKIGPDDLVLIADNNLRRYNSESVLDYDKIPDDLITTKGHFCVIVGGESQGISKEALTFAKSRNWKVVNIPIESTANSLNISNALAIILFELRRKFNLLL
ncbi:rRNA methyltransferase 3, mitochondrial [Chironomus tepperi]|uniref:rRNA methyltransferase 3, mitochondrial n=1 Tax=Chironomus tepperi TaxID=113505 RepID=UPI00391F0905